MLVSETQIPDTYPTSGIRNPEEVAAITNRQTDKQWDREGVHIPQM